MASYPYRKDYPYRNEENKSIDEKLKNGPTPLLVAIRDTNYELIDLLLKNGADLNEADDTGQTPLLVAVAKKNYHLVQKLLDAGANINKAAPKHGPPTNAGKDSAPRFYKVT